MWATGSAGAGWALAAGALTFAAGPAEACALALVLALDVSSSVDADEDQLQRQGLAAALMAPDVQAAFRALGPVAVTVFEWSGAASQSDLSGGWVMVADEGDLTALAAALSASQRGAEGQSTGLGSALIHASGLIGAGPACGRAVIDLSGDGQNNEGPGPAAAYADPAFDRIMVNALLITSPASAHAMISWFGQHVLHGPGAFLQVADGYADYQVAMEQKLIRELRPAALSLRQSSQPRG
jgi:hypothetical protein